MTVTGEYSARFELIVRAAIGALYFAGFSDIQKDARVHAPKRGFVAGTVQWQIVCIDGDGVGSQVSAGIRGGLRHREISCELNCWGLYQGGHYN